MAQVTTTQAERQSTNSASLAPGTLFLMDGTIPCIQGVLPDGTKAAVNLASGAVAPGANYACTVPINDDTFVLRNPE